MPANRYSAPGEGWNQNKQRVVKIFYDQHKNDKAGFPLGRPWWAYCERQVDGSDAKPVAELLPVSADFQLPDGMGGNIIIKGWCAPWTPEPKYVAIAFQSMQGNRFVFNYNRMRSDYEEASMRYYRNANREAAAKNWPSVKVYGPVPFQLQSVEGVGAPPKSPKVPEAALAGDLWLLGFTQEENERLKAILDEDNGRGTYFNEGATPIAATPPSLSEFADFTEEEREALKEMVAARRARKAKTTTSEAA
jgi:hypothetical protein